jgi:hypothetical protein
MPVYSAYGLIIESELEIPELAVPGDTSLSHDVSIRYGRVPDVSGQGDEEQGFAVLLSEGEAVYAKGRCGRFLVRDGNEILVEPDEGIEDRIVRLSLFGPALALILIQRGFLVLHGGAVAFPGGTVILLGPGGAGKSTLTGELCKQGGKLFSDDVVALDMSQSPPLVMPGVPLLKLWLDAVEGAPGGVWTQTLHPDFDKVGRRLDDSTLSAPAPVSRIFVLAVSKEMARTAVSGEEAFRLLLASLFAARYGDNYINKMNATELLARLSRLMQYAPVEVLRRPNDPQLLPDSAAMIIDSLA